MKLKLALVFFFAIILSETVNAQLFTGLFKKPPIHILVKKQGCYIGMEKGVLDFFELGTEFQRKRIKGNKFTVNAFTYGFNYSIKENLMGYSMSYYHKKGVLGLTGGVELSAVTDFKNIQPSASPLFGFKLSGFHIQTGYKIIYPRLTDFSMNTFFIRLRFTINRNTEWKFVRDYNKKKKK